MSAKPTQGVTFSAPPTGRAEERMPDWHALWIFLQLSRHGSFRACERELRMTVTSIRRSINGLEASLGLRLLTRHPDGIRITSEGQRVAEIAADMEGKALDLLRVRDALAQDAEGSVRIAVTEGLGAVWLTPRLVAFQRESPGIQVDLACGMTSADVLRMEADVAIQVTRPTAQDVKVVRLGNLHVMPYASRNYLELHGKPSDLQQLSKHRLVIQIAEQVTSVQILQQIFRDIPFVGVVSNTTNASSAHVLAIANGAGIGWLPTYVSPLRTGLIPIECGATARLDIWMTYHADVEKIARVRRVIDWIRGSFDAKAYPFFGEAFVPPEQLNPIIDAISLRELFEGFTE